MAMDMVHSRVVSLREAGDRLLLFLLRRLFKAPFVKSQ